MKKIFFIVSLMLFAGDAFAQSVRSLQTEVDEMREDLKIIQRRLYDKDGGLGGGSTPADTTVRIGEMEENVRNVVGRMDMLEYKLKSLEERIEVINKDIDVRIKMIEGKPITQNSTANVSAMPSFSAPVAEGAPKSLVGEAIDGSALQPVTGQSVEEIYQRGIDELRLNDNDKAIVTFGKIVSQYPGDKLAGNAQYWQGEGYYAKKDYEQAAIAFAKGYQNYKDSTKGPDSLLKLGMSMAALKKNPEACAAFTSLAKEFPKSSQDMKDRAKKEAAALNCK